MFNKLLVPTDGSELSIAAAVRAVSLARLAGASMTSVFVQGAYSYTGIGEANSAGLQAYTAEAREAGTEASKRIRDAAAAQGVAIDSIMAENHQTARGIVDAAQP